jgi:hypothetical protein
VTEIEPIIFFIDRPLGGKFVPNALRQAGAQVEVHHEHFPRIPGILTGCQRQPNGDWY